MSISLYYTVLNNRSSKIYKPVYCWEIERALKRFCKQQNVFNFYSFETLKIPIEIKFVFEEPPNIFQHY